MADLETLLTYLTLISVPIGVIYHIMTLSNTRKNQQMQLETRQAQLFMGIYDKDLQRQNLKAQTNVTDMEFDGIEDFEEKYGKENNPEAYIDWMYHLDYMEGIGVFVREGLVDVRLVTLLS